jgi:hypothetical protein
MNNMVDVEAGADDHSVFWLGTMLLICLVVYQNEVHTMQVIA